jgi:hypothetical protein
MDDGSGGGVADTVWRRALQADAPYTKLADTTLLAYTDDNAGTGAYEHEVTFTIAP